MAFTCTAYIAQKTNKYKRKISHVNIPTNITQKKKKRLHILRNMKTKKKLLYICLLHDSSGEQR